MWFITEPEELKNYQCKISLKKAKEALVWRYYHLSGEDIKHLPENHILRKGRVLFRDNLWYTGISSNPLLSLSAHGIDLNQNNKFVCWVIPVKFARELKAEALTLDQFQHVTNDASDYIAEEQPYTYLYNFLVEKESIFSIDPTGFTPLKYIPYRPAQVFAWHPDGSRTSRNIETKDWDSYPEILRDLLEKAQAGEITRLLLRCQAGKIMQCDFRADGCDLYFDACTSQSGYVYWYRPGEGQERDWQLLYDILLYFLRFYKKQKGTKWKYVQKELTLE